MIEILSSIASILGFSLQLYDKFNDLNPKSSKNEDEIILLFLKECKLPVKYVLQNTCKLPVKYVLQNTKN